MRCFGFALLCYGMWSQRTAKGISLKTLQGYAVVFIARLLSILRHQGYLPFDKTGDWFYHTVEILSFSIILLTLYGIYTPFISTYEEKYDRFGFYRIPNEYGILYLVIPMLILAVLYQP